MPQSVDEARGYLSGAALRFDTAHKLWRQLKADNEISLARSVLARMRSDQGLLNGVPSVSLTTGDARRRVTIYDLNLALFMRGRCRGRTELRWYSTLDAKALSIAIARVRLFRSIRQLIGEIQHGDHQR